MSSTSTSAIFSSDDGLRPLLDALGCLAVVHDPENRVVTMNALAETFTGYRADEVAGRVFWQHLVAPEDADTYQDQFARVEGHVLPAGHETSWILRNGERRRVVWTHRPLEAAGARLLLTTGFDVTDRRAREERLQYLAYHDDLTGLDNRRRFEDELVRHLAHAERYDEPLTVLALDLDGLKAVNDEFGHPAGDDLLRGVARRLRARLRSSDVLARLGGDEFGALLPMADEQQAERVSEQLRTAVADAPFSVFGRRLTVTISVGLASRRPGVSARALMRRADAALYADKRGEGVGEDRYHAVVERQRRREAMRPRADA